MQPWSILTCKMSPTYPSVQKYKATKISTKNKCEIPISTVVHWSNRIWFNCIKMWTRSHFNDVDVEVSTVTSERRERYWIKDTDENSQYQSEILTRYDTYPEEEEVTYRESNPKLLMAKDASLILIPIMVVDTIRIEKPKTVLKVLLERTATKTRVRKKTLPRGDSSIPLEEAKKIER